MRIGLTSRLCLTLHQNKWIFLGSIFFLLSSQLHAQCTLACNNQINLGLDADCSEEITPGLILQAYNGCDPANFLVTVYQSNGINILPTSPFVTSLEIGSLLPVKVEHPASGTSCWSSVLVSDNLPPQLICPPDLTISCTSSLDPFTVGNPQITECQSYTLTYFDQYTDLGCTDPTGFYTRTWNAADASGNFNSCTQVITINQPDLSQVVFPPNYNGTDAPALECPNPNVSTAATGVPFLDGAPIVEGGNCELSVFFTDLEIDGCQGSYAILRTWSVLEWCSGQLEQQTQVILIDDSTPPTVEIPDTMVVSTNNQLACTATITMPAAIISDACADSLEVLILAPFGSISSNGGQFFDVPFGEYEIVYQVSDPCGNVNPDTLILQVIDALPPIAICDQITAVSLGPFGTTMVFATTFDDGSFDNCCPVNITARRTDINDCGQSGDFENSVTFCCSDISQVIDVEVRIADCFDNENFCDVTVFVNDQIDPEIVCPVPANISCAANPLDLSLTGEPFVFDGCGVDSVYFQDIEDLNDCNIGFITRTWTVLDSLGNSASCSQIINLIDQTPVEITFPSNLDLFGCYLLEDLDPEDLVAPYDAPIIINDDCELIAINVSDEVFTVTPDACLKIIRTWTLIDWCVYESNSGSTDGMYVGVQTIKVIDDEAPSITCPPNQVVEIIDNTCQATVNLSDATVDDCDPNYETSIISDFGTGNGPFTNIDIGIYEASYFATDGCNNTTSCTINIEVIDGKAPTPYCIAGINVVLMAIDTGGTSDPDIAMIDIDAIDFDLGSFDNCDTDLTFSFSTDSLNSIITYDCSNLGLNVVQLWVTDDAGNQDFCETFITIQENTGVCNGGMLPIVSGLITDELGQAIEEVEVSISDATQQVVYTDLEGMYEFGDLVLGLDYSVVPQFDTAIRNGVTTWDLAYMTKHILGVQLLDSPYKIIAADADRSGTISTVDIVELQQIIMFLEDDLPNNNTSWRFVPTDYVFQNPLDPLQEGFPEVINLNNLDDDVLDADFMGVKVGDVNNSANPGINGGLDQRTIFNWKAICSGQMIAPNTYFEIAIYPDEVIETSALQGSFAFNPAFAEIINIEGPGDALNFGFPPDYPGVITYSWLDSEVQLLNPNEPFLILSGISKKSINLSEVIHTSDLVLNEIYQENQTPLQWTFELISEVQAEDWNVYPTVFQEQIEICIEDSRNLEIIQLVNASGNWKREVEVRSCQKLNAALFPGPGIYFVIRKGGKAIKKIVLVE